MPLLPPALRLPAPRSRTLPALAAAAATALLLTACGTTETTAPAGGAETGSSTAGGAVTVTDERGAVELDAPAASVVSLEWGLTENLLSLGVDVVGQADVEGYNTWATVEPLDPATPDVGTRGEPSLDAIVALDPDLVVTTTDIDEAVIAQLAEQVPVIALRGSDSADPLGYMRSTVETLATATGTQDAGEQLLTDFDAKVADGQARLEAAGRTGAPFVLADGWDDAGAVSVRLYTPGSFVGAIGDELGLVNQWTEGGDPDYGLAATDVEGLTRISDPATTFVYGANDADGGSLFTDALAGNAVWQQLPFVTGDRVRRTPDGLWPFGGPASGSAYVDALVTAVTS